MNNCSFIFTLCVCLLVSCSTSNSNKKGTAEKSTTTNADEKLTNEEIVRQEFENYVKLKFDNPDDLKEIVEIIAIDTLSHENVCNLASKALTLTNMVEEGDSLYSSAADNYQLEQEAIIQMYSDASCMSTRNRNRMRDLLEEDIEFIEDGVYKKIKMRECKNNLQSQLNSLNYHPAIYVYQINYRINTNGSYQLNSHYSYIDSLNGFIKIDPKYNTTEVLCREYVDVYDNALQLICLATELGDDISDAIERLEEKIHITNIEFGRTYTLPYWP